ncbi:MAG: class I SAM-dependent methyltransferase [Steroidobacteraceae bacterium]
MVGENQPMINQIHSLLYRPERGWDPVPPNHAEKYACNAWSTEVRSDLIDELETWMNGFDGKQVLDLGGGAGQYSIAFAKLGADVTWHDVSTIYRGYTQSKAQENHVHINLSLGYMDEAPEILKKQYDLVFNRICWNYCFDDRSFGKILFSLIKPGGIGYVDTTHSDWNRDSLSAFVRARTWLNDRFAFKVGHPFPPHGRLAKLFFSMPIEKLLLDYSTKTNDRILFRRLSDS